MGPSDRRCPCGTAISGYNLSGMCRPCISRASNPPAAIPDDFAERAAVMSNEALRAHYKRGTKIIARWRRQSGVRARKGCRIGGPTNKLPIPDGFAAIAPTKSKRQLGIQFGVANSVISRWCMEAGVRSGTHQIERAGGGSDRYFNRSIYSHRDMTRAGMAAEYLRRFGPVKRANARGVYDPKGDYWWRGSSLLTADEIIERALRNGWNPDAWRELSAA